MVTTPENVGEPCVCLGTKLRVTTSPDGREVYHGPGPCPICSPPESVECPGCDTLMDEAMQWRDWQSIDMGLYCDKHDPTTLESVVPL